MYTIFLPIIAIVALILFTIIRDHNTDFWYDPYTDMSWPKCHKCKGERTTDCPEDCQGDV